MYTTAAAANQQTTAAREDSQERDTREFLNQFWAYLNYFKPNLVILGQLLVILSLT